MRRLLPLCLVIHYAFGADAPQTVEPWLQKLRDYFASGQADKADLLDSVLSNPNMFDAHASWAIRAATRNADRGRGAQKFSSASARNGSTSLVSLAGSPDILGNALESGGFSQQTSGTVTTLTLKPAGLVDLLRGKPQCPKYLVLLRRDAGCAMDGPFGGLSFNVSLDVSRDTAVKSKPEAFIDSLGKTSPLIATGGSVVRLISDPRTVSSWGARYELRNARRPGVPALLKSWRAPLKDEKVTTAADQLAKTIAKLKQAELQPEYIKWRGQAKDEIERAQTWEEVQKAYERQLAAWGDLNSVKESTGLEKDLIAARDGLVDAENAALRKELEKAIVTLEYTNSRPLSQPDLSNIKLAISQPLGVGKMLESGGSEGTFTFNAGVDLYNTIPNGAKVGRLRDVQAAIRFDIPGGKLGDKGTLTYNLEAYYQYQIEKGIIEIGSGSVLPNTGIQLPSDAKTLLAPKGGTFIAQARATLKAKDAKTSIPIGISWASRSELIKADHVIAGHIGLTFDWNSLLPQP